jgi:hypothetical protein
MTAIGLPEQVSWFFHLCGMAVFAYIGSMNNSPYNSADRIKLTVFNTKAVETDVFDLVQSVLECLNPVQGTDHTLRELWLEVQWLKTTVRQHGTVIVPDTFELMLFQMANGNHTVINKFPVLKQRVQTLAAALQPIIER